MKKAKIKLQWSLIILFTFFGLTSNLSCTDSDCNQVAQYSDLLTSLIDITSGTINVNDNIVIANEITNEGIRNVCEILSETAPESKYSLDFDYRENSSSPWITSAARAVIQVNELAANSSTTENFQFVFNQSGDYRISGLADSENDVVERNEDNNGKEFEQSKNLNNNSNNNLFISVLKGERKIRINIDEPIIKIEENKNKNLVSFKSISIRESAN